MCGGTGAKLGLDMTGYEEKKRQANMAIEEQKKANQIALETAAKEAEVAKQAQEQAKALAEAEASMKANFATDLTQENVGTVVAAGSAEQSMAQSDMTKKKKRVSGLASQLGINV